MGLYQAEGGPISHGLEWTLSCRQQGRERSDLSLSTDSSYPGGYGFEPLWSHVGESWCHLNQVSGPGNGEESLCGIDTAWWVGRGVGRDASPKAGGPQRSRLGQKELRAQLVSLRCLRGSGGRVHGAADLRGCAETSASVKLACLQDSLAAFAVDVSMALLLESVPYIHP